MISKEYRKGMIMMVLSAVFFSFKPVLTKLAYRYGVQPDTLLSMRMLIAVPLFWLFYLITAGDKKASAVTKKDILSFMAAGFIGFFLAAETGFYSLKYIDASVSTLLIYTYPSIVTILSYFILGERITYRKAAALITVFAGTLSVLDVFSITDKNISLKGALLSLSAALFFSLYYIMIRILSKGISSIRLTTYLITFGGIFVIIYQGGKGINQPYEVWLLASGIAILGTLFPFLLLGEGVKMIGPSNAAIFSAFGPVSTITLSYLLLGEKLSIYQFMGAAFIISGIVTLGRKRDNESNLKH